METFLVLLSGLCWSIVYIELIRNGFKNKTYGMPLFALGLNFAWETIYAYDGLIVLGDLSNPQSWVNLVWALLDVVIVISFFKYGKKYFPKEVQRYFVPFGILAFAACFVMQLAFYLEFPSEPASIYSAFVQNAAMSLLFLGMLYSRKGTEGQTIIIAIAKWLGTLAPTILGGILQANIYMLLMGIICCVFDISYIFALAKKKKGSKTLAVDK